MINISRVIFGFAVILLGCCLGGCESQSETTPVVYRPLTTQEQVLVKKIRASGAKVYKLGDQVTLILPVDRYFNLAPLQVRESRMKALDCVAKFVQHYGSSYTPHARIVVTGYSDNVYKRTERLAVSRQYANIVASYLWKHGVKRRYMVVKGEGKRHPVASNRTAEGSAHNRRVVIRIH